MYALILDNNPRRLEQGQLAFLEEGVQITGTGAVPVALTCIDRFGVDILVIDRRSVGKRFAEVVRMAERRNPNLVTIALTPDVSGDTDRMVQAFPSMSCVLGADLAPSVAAKLALASVVQQKETPITAQETAQRMPSEDDIKLTSPQPGWDEPAPRASIFEEPEPQPEPQVARVVSDHGVAVARILQDEGGQIARIARGDGDAPRTRAVSPVFSSIRRARSAQTVAA